MGILRLVTTAILQGAIFGKKVLDPVSDGFGETEKPSMRDIAEEISKDLRELLNERYRLQASSITVRWVSGERGFIGMVYLEGCTEESWSDLHRIEERLCYLLNGMGYEVRGLFFSSRLPRLAGASYPRG